jgi:archaellum biogenesis protein FlaJ (TadC family)
MKKHKTIHGFLRFMGEVESTSISGLIGYDKLSEEDEKLLGGLMCDISNAYWELIDSLNDNKSFKKLAKKANAKRYNSN